MRASIAALTRRAAHPISPVCDVLRIVFRPIWICSELGHRNTCTAEALHHFVFVVVVVA